jgi:hypothetical protein
VTENKGLDLSSLLDDGSAKQEQPSAEQVEQDIVLHFEELINSIHAKIQDANDMITSMHVAIGTVSARLSQAEKYIAYLLEKDPDMGPKIRAMQAQMAEAEAKNAKEQDKTSV